MANVKCKPHATQTSQSFVFLFRNTAEFFVNGDKIAFVCVVLIVLEIGLQNR